MKEVERRWRENIPHDGRSRRLYKTIARINNQEGTDYFGWKSGGDGDNGEELMFLLDIYFEERDAESTAALSDLILRVTPMLPAVPAFGETLEQTRAKVLAEVVHEHLKEEPASDE